MPRAQTVLFTTLLRALVICIFLLLVLLDVSRSLWIDLAGLAVTGALLIAVIALALRRSPRPAGRGAGGEDPTPSPTPPRPPR